ncbi:hypothetical protein LDG_5593 [Legionella drancourtii LLAP12]|uniref:Uncharacterized protein n=1 Tax=Legionella drancourtii LLAP12 TaxID=658187 RepID=G9EK70_9GAMM|nr:hypothetical protein LDG_5593 [Legionella drancourtii LLAP12]
MLIGFHWKFSIGAIVNKFHQGPIFQLLIMNLSCAVSQFNTR